MSDSILIRLQRALAKGQLISPLGALEDFDCLSLSQRMGDLRRKHGWPILSKFVTNRRGKRFKVYWLDTRKGK